MMFNENKMGAKYCPNNSYQVLNWLPFLPKIPHFEDKTHSGKESFVHWTSVLQSKIGKFKVYKENPCFYCPPIYHRKTVWRCLTTRIMLVNGMMWAALRLMDMSAREIQVGSQDGFLSGEVNWGLHFSYLLMMLIWHYKLMAKKGEKIPGSGWKHKPNFRLVILKLWLSFLCIKNWFGSM